MFTYIRYVHVYTCITSRISWIRERKWKPYANVSRLEMYLSRVIPTAEY